MTYGKKNPFIFMPLYSIQAWGRFYGPYPHGWWYPNDTYQKGYAIYQRRHTWHGIINIKEHYYFPYNPRTPKQQQQRYKLRDGVTVWHTLTNERKDEYNKKRYPTGMSGFNKFLHYYMRNKPG